MHATGQVASVDVETAGPLPEHAADALNAELPPDVAVLRVEPAEPDFHARFSARSRSYRYRIFRRRIRSPFAERHTLYGPRPLDVDVLRAMAGLLPGASGAPRMASS